VLIVACSRIDAAGSNKKMLAFFLKKIFVGGQHRIDVACMGMTGVGIQVLRSLPSTPCLVGDKKNFVTL